MKVGDEVICTAMWVHGWHGVIIELRPGMAKVKWNDRTAGECWIESEQLKPIWSNP